MVGKILIMGLLFFNLQCQEDVAFEVEELETEQHQEQAEELEAAPEVDLQILNLKQQPMQKATTNQPFYVSVKVATDSSDAFDCAVGNLDTHLSVLDKSYSTSYGFGEAKQRSYRINYRVVAESEGTFSIGPAKITMNGKQYYSQPTDVAIEFGVPFVTLSTDAKDVVEREQFKVTAKAYFEEGYAARWRVPEYLSPGLKILKVSEVKEGAEQFKGKDVKFGKWDIFVAPEKSGALQINPIKASIESTGRQQGVFSVFDFEMPGFGTQWVTSNALDINIKPLPDPEIDAVGRFKNFQISFNDTSASVGDGLVLTAELEGEADLENIVYRGLQLPEGLSFYESKSFVKDGKKYFEFMVQGKEPGKFKIPQQIFTYFDVVTRKCALLKSNTLKLEVTEKAAAKKGAEPTARNLDLLAPVTEFKAGVSSGFAIPQRYFLLLLLLPILLLLFWSRPRRISKKDKFKEAEKEIASCCDSGQLIVVFYRLLNVASSSRLAALLKARGLAQPEIKSWLQFYQQLEQERYFKGNQNFAALKSKAAELLRLLRL